MSFSFNGANDFAAAAAADDDDVDVFGAAYDDADDVDDYDESELTSLFLFSISIEISRDFSSTRASCCSLYLPTASCHNHYYDKQTVGKSQTTSPPRGYPVAVCTSQPECDEYIRIFEYSNILVTNMLNCKLNSTNGGTFSNSAEKMVLIFLLLQRALVISK